MLPEQHFGNQYRRHSWDQRYQSHAGQYYVPQHKHPSAVDALSASIGYQRTSASPVPRSSNDQDSNAPRNRVNQSNNGWTSNPAHQAPAPNIPSPEATTARNDTITQCMTSVWNVGYVLDQDHCSFTEYLVPLWHEKTQPLQRFHALLGLLDEEVTRISPWLLQIGHPEATEFERWQLRKWQEEMIVGLENGVRMKMADVWGGCMRL